LDLSRRRRAAADDDSPGESSILCTCAFALADSTMTRRKARALAFRAAGYNSGNAGALGLIREIDSRPSSRSVLHKMLIRGIWSEPFEHSKNPPGFFRSCHVSAPDEKTALRYVRRFFPLEVRASLAIEECKTIPLDQGKWDGVYFLSSLMFYQRRHP
jgi:hypothetical protein